MKTKSPERKKRIPYSEFSECRWHLNQAVAFLHEIAGEGHDDEDFLQYIDDLWILLGLLSS
jgi:hypothetical protein